MEDNKGVDKKENKYRLNYLRNFILIFGIFYILLGIFFFLFITTINAFVPVEYITYLNEFVESSNPFNFGIFFLFTDVGLIFIMIGVLFLIEFMLIIFNISQFKFLGIIISILQIWLFPLGTFAGYLIISELLHVKKQ
ncbi:MAG: hypothetical protein ACTSQO_13110 [Candidatus Helarchaeota archaeon]